jgi:transposase
MPRTRRPYPPEFRDHILSLARQGRSAWDLAEEFEPCHATIRSWMLKAGIASEFNEPDGIEADPDGELARLRRENAVLREEKEILAKAAAWFAEETGRTPRGRSSS